MQDINPQIGSIHSGDLWRVWRIQPSDFPPWKVFDCSLRSFLNAQGYQQKQSLLGTLAVYKCCLVGIVTCEMFCSLENEFSGKSHEPRGILEIPSVSLGDFEDIS